MKEIDGKGLKDWIAQGKPMLLLDVREPAELRSPPGRIEGVVNIPLGQLSARLPEIAAWKGRTVLSICRSGARATSAARFLESAGFTDVVLLRGGMMMYNR
jgi:rhodanese-related sulfurtransferase